MQAVIAAARTIRSEHEVHPAAQVRLVLRAGDPAQRALLASESVSDPHPGQDPGRSGHRARRRRPPSGERDERRAVTSRFSSSCRGSSREPKRGLRASNARSRRSKRISS